MRSRITCLGVFSVQPKFRPILAASLRPAFVTLAAFSLLLLFLLPAAQAQTETVLYNFCNSGNCASGGFWPDGRLTLDNSGNLYGINVDGGSGSSGTVFELSPAPPAGCASGSNPGNGWCETVLYNFCSVTNCADGYFPVFSSLIFDKSGNLYGTTEVGGTPTGTSCANGRLGCGTVFELSPQPGGDCPSGSNPGNGWCETVLYSFCSQANCADGNSPYNGLVWDSSGDLYGTAYGVFNPQGVYQGGGGVFELSPSGGHWTEQMIYSANINGMGGLAIDSTANLYGVVTGAKTDKGQVFKLSFANGVWTPTTIYSFNGGTGDGEYPDGPPAVDSFGNVYGTTNEGGIKNLGTIWKLIPEAGTYTEQILYSFPSKKDGYCACSGVTLDPSGNIFGTTKYKYGTVFELAATGASYQYRLVWTFDYTDGEAPEASVTIDSAGRLFGTTFTGGPYCGDVGCGNVFVVNPSGAPTTATIASSPNPSNLGETVTFTATVSSEAGPPPNGESVSFMKGTTLLGTGTLSGGSATFSTSSLPAGTSKVEAVYGGDLNFGPSTTKALKQVVEK